MESLHPPCCKSMPYLEALPSFQAVAPLTASKHDSTDHTAASKLKLSQRFSITNLLAGYPWMLCIRGSQTNTGFASEPTKHNHCSSNRLSTARRLATPVCSSSSLQTLPQQPLQHSASAVFIPQRLLLPLDIQPAGAVTASMMPCKGPLHSRAPPAGR